LTQQPTNDERYSSIRFLAFGFVRLKLKRTKHELSHALKAWYLPKDHKIGAACVWKKNWGNGGRSPIETFDTWKCVWRENRSKSI